MSKPVEHDEESREPEELRAVFKAITEFIKEIKQPIREIVEYLYKQLDGAKIGEDVANFYKKLIEQGVPKELAEKMTLDYMKTRLQVVADLANISKLLGMGRGGKGFPVVITKTGEGKTPGIKIITGREEEEKKREEEEE